MQHAKNDPKPPLSLSASCAVQKRQNTHDHSSSNLNTHFARFLSLVRQLEPHPSHRVSTVAHNLPVNSTFLCQRHINSNRWVKRRSNQYCSSSQIVYCSGVHPILASCSPVIPHQEITRIVRFKLLQTCPPATQHPITQLNGTHQTTKSQITRATTTTEQAPFDDPSSLPTHIKKTTRYSLTPPRALITPATPTPYPATCVTRTATTKHRKTLHLTTCV